MLIKEFRIVLPVTVEEYQVGQLYSVADASKNETGGGEGIEIKANEPYVDKPIFHGEYSAGQYTHKIYHLASKVPKWVRVLAPKGSLEFKEEAWNAYPYCTTVVTNPDYMKDTFQISSETMHLADRGETENAHRLTEDELKKREVIYIDIANDPVRSGDYKADEDPTKFKSEKSGRGPLTGRWKDTTTPVMCAYKLVRCEFIWFGLQGRVEKFIMNGERRIFTNFHRQVFCWMDKWLGMTMEEIRELEERNKIELDEARSKGAVQGTSGE